MSAEATLAAKIDQLVDEYRLRCLWFLRADYYPVTDEDRLRTLDYIERYGDREGYRRAAEARRWLLHHFNVPSATS